MNTSYYPPLLALTPLPAVMPAAPTPMPNMGACSSPAHTPRASLRFDATDGQAGNSKNVQAARMDDAIDEWVEQVPTHELRTNLASIMRTFKHSMAEEYRQHRAEVVAQQEEITKLRAEV